MPRGKSTLEDKIREDIPERKELQENCRSECKLFEDFKQLNRLEDGRIGTRTVVAIRKLTF